MVCSLYKSISQTPNLFAKRINRYTHVHPELLKSICKTAGILSDEPKDAIDNVDAACELCVRNGRPLPSKNISLNHVNGTFNEELQVDFTDITIYDHQTANTTLQGSRKYKFQLIIFTCTGSGYSEGDIAPRKTAQAIVGAHDRLRLCRRRLTLHDHGASRYISADDEYHNRILSEHFDAYGTKFKARPTRRHNKLGYVERKNGTIQAIIRKLAVDIGTSAIERSDVPISTGGNGTIVARPIFLSNMFSGSQLLGSFELARGYHPSILGIQSAPVTQELMDSHTRQVATRALQRVLRSRTPDIRTPGMFKVGDTVWVWYASTKNNEPDEWIEDRIVTIHKHYLEVRRLRNGQPITRGLTMKPAYEDIRVAPQGRLTRELMNCSLEQELGYSGSTERGVEDRTTNDAPQPKVSSFMTGKTSRKESADDIGNYAENMHPDREEIYATLKSEGALAYSTIFTNR